MPVIASYINLRAQELDGMADRRRLSSEPDTRLFRWGTLMHTCFAFTAESGAHGPPDHDRREPKTSAKPRKYKQKSERLIGAGEIEGPRPLCGTAVAG